MIIREIALPRARETFFGVKTSRAKRGRFSHQKKSSGPEVKQSPLESF